MPSKEHTYLAGATSCKGYFAWPENKAKSPLVLIAPTYEGITPFAKKQADELTCHGYSAFVIDFYGNGKQASSAVEAEEWMMPLFINRKTLLERMTAVYLAVKELPEVDSNNIAAIGFCFGGLAVIELLRSGAKLNGVVSFHGVLGNQLGGHLAQLIPHPLHIEGSLLILHGYKDPLVPMDDLLALQKEMSKAGVDWQSHIFGSAAHAFTNPDVHDTSGGMYYDPLSCKRSMIALYNYLKECFIDLNS